MISDVKTSLILFDFEIQLLVKNMAMQSGGSPTGSFCLVVEFLRKGSATNKATPCSFNNINSESTTKC